MAKRSGTDLLTLFVAPVAVVLIGGGLTWWLAYLGNHAAAKTVASLAIVLGLALFGVIWWVQRDSSEKAQRRQLRELLEGHIERGEVIADLEHGPYWWEQFDKWAKSVTESLRSPLGPKIANEFSVAIPQYPKGGPIDYREEVRSRLDFLAVLLANVDSLRIMKDWRP